MNKSCFNSIENRTLLSRQTTAIRLLLLVLLVGLFSNVSIAQTNIWDGSSGTNWNTAANWSLNVVPDDKQNVVIPAGVSNMPRISTAAAECKNLTVEAGATLTVDIQDFDVFGTAAISGTIGFTNTPSANNTGKKTFYGLIVINPGGTWNNSANVDITVRGGIDNNGTFTAGTGDYTFNTNSPQTLSGVLSFTRVVVGTNVILTNTGTLTVTGQLVGSNGELINKGILNIGGTSTIKTLTATAPGNTVNYNGVNQDVKTTTYNNLTLSGSGTKTFKGTTTISNNLVIETGVIANLGSFIHPAGTLTLGGHNQNSGFWGGTASLAANKSQTYFGSSVTGMISVDSTCTGVAITIAGPSLICKGASATFTATTSYAISPTYQWKVNGVNAGTNSDSFTTTTLSNTDVVTCQVSSGAARCLPSGSTATSNSITMSVSTLTATATPAAVESGANVSLATAILPTTYTATLLAQDFNSTPTGWTTTNTSVTPNPSYANWTLRGDGYFYDYGSGFAPFTFRSNDKTQFYLTNSAAKGSGATNTTLVSPAMNSTGYTSLSLEFYQYYNDYDGDDSAIVEVSTNGTNWTALATYTSDQGTQNNFAKTTIDLNGYIGNSTLYVRFRYTANFDWFWAIDNVKITGNRPVTYTYSWAATPSGASAGLPANAGTPLGTNANITANPTATTSYIATAINSVTSCTVASSAVVVTITPTAPLGPALQFFCEDATVAELVAVGTAIKWYDVASGGSALATTTVLVNGATYYASQTISGTESTARLAVTVTISPDLATPVIGTITQPSCTSATGSVVLNNLPSGSWLLTRTPGNVVTSGSGVTTTISGLSQGTYTFSVNGLPNGLKAEFFNSAPFSNSPAFPTTTPDLVRTDAEVNFNLGTGSPDPSINADYYFARWSGLVQPQYSETYTFQTNNNDGLRLWVNGQLIIDSWINQFDTTNNTGTITLIGGLKYSIVLEYYEGKGTSSCKLQWSSPSLPLEVIPNSRLFTIGNCPSDQSDEVVINAQPTTAIWNGTSWTGTTPVGSNPTISQPIEFHAYYSSSSNLNGCSCEVKSNVTVNINSGHTLTLTDKLTVAPSATMAFFNNASLVQVNDVLNEGDIDYERSTITDVRNTDYTYWSSPVSPQSIGDFSPNTLNGMMYSFDSSIDDWKQESLSTSMVEGVGYIVRGPEPSSFPPPPPGTFTANFIGVPNNGSYSVPAIANNSILIGNPYPSAIDADTFLEDNASVLLGTLYFWTHKTEIKDRDEITNPGSGLYAYSGDDYAVYNATGGVAATQPDTDELGNPYPSTVPTGNIGAGQGFFGTAKATGTVNFTNTMRIAGSNYQFYKTRNPKMAKTINKSRIWLNMTNKKGAFKQTLVGYITNATNEYDDRFDGESFDGNEFIDFYSVNQDKNLTIQGRALPFDENDEVPLGYRTTINGDFTIRIDQTDGLLNNQSVFIEDKLTNTVFDLKNGNYTFNTTAGTFNDRLVLKYKDSTDDKNLGTPTPTNPTNAVIVSNTNKQIKINSFAETMDKVVIYDLLGRQIYKNDKVDANELSITNLVSSRQVLLVKTTLKNGKTTTDKIVF